MMLPTHALVGLVLAVPVAFYAPEFAGIALLSGLAGGIVPDLDLYTGHRKTLHYPVYYSGFGLIAVPVAALAPTAVTVALSVALIAAAVHSIMDIFGGGLELRPWEATSDRAVYDHFRGRWIAPRRWVRYDGAPEDFLLSVAIAGPLLLVLDGVFAAVVVAAVLISAAYAALRRTLPTIAEVLVQEVAVKSLPERALLYLPARYLGE